MPNSEKPHVHGWLEDEIDINDCVVTGTVTRDPEMQKTAGGVEFADFQIASRELRDAGERIVRHTNLIEVRAGGEKATRCCQRLRIGTRVMIKGSLAYKEEELPGGGKRGVLRVAAIQVKATGRAPSGPFADTGRDRDGSPRSAPGGDRRAQAAQADNAQRAPTASS